jgi:hypothetical protein
MSKIIAFLLIFLSTFYFSAQSARADELPEYEPGWYAKVNYTIPAGGSWTCINVEEPDCVTHYVPYPASQHEYFSFISDWDIGLTARVISQSSRLCTVGLFDSRRGKLWQEEVFRGWVGGNILNSCTILEKKPCEVEGFTICIARKFSTKFPFDILFNLPSAEITCPTVNFFGSEFDLCFIYEVMRLMKYPIAAALIVKFFLYL